MNLKINFLLSFLMAFLIGFINSCEVNGVAPELSNFTVNELSEVAVDSGTIVHLKVDYYDEDGDIENCDFRFISTVYALKDHGSYSFLELDKTGDDYSGTFTWDYLVQEDPGFYYYEFWSIDEKLHYAKKVYVKIQVIDPDAES